MSDRLAEVVTEVDALIVEVNSWLSSIEGHRWYQAASDLLGGLVAKLEGYKDGIANDTLPAEYAQDKLFHSMYELQRMLKEWRAHFTEDDDS